MTTNHVVGGSNPPGCAIFFFESSSLVDFIDFGCGLVWDEFGASREVRTSVFGQKEQEAPFGRKP
jgi:hypothetical protein